MTILTTKLQNNLDSIKCLRKTCAVFFRLRLRMSCLLHPKTIKPRGRITSSSAFTLVAGGLCCLWSHSLLAELDYFALEPEMLINAQVVSVSKRQETLAEAPAAIYVVDSEDIARSGATNIPDALRLVPGVNVARSDSNSWAVSIRGFNGSLANKLLVLLDGRTLYNPVFGGVLWEAHDLMLEDIARIEVIRGPGGSLWGANAVNGVINIISKHSRETQGVLASAAYGKEEPGTVNARHGGAFGDDDYYRVYAKGFRRDSSMRPNGQDAYDQWDGLRTGFRADWNDNITVLGDAYRNTAEQRRRYYALTEPYVVLENQELVYEGAHISGRWLEAYEQGASWSMQTYLDWSKRNEPFNFVDDRIIYDLETQYNLARIGAQEIIVGAGFRMLTGEETGNRNVAFSPARRRDNIYNGFVQDKVTLVPDRWFVTIGSKIERNEFSGTEVQPNIRLQWTPGGQQSLWSSVARAVRTPTPLEQDITSTLGTAKNVRVAFVPNKDFRSEILTAYEMGYRKQFAEYFTADFAIFYNDYTHLQTISVQPGTPINDGIEPLHVLVPVKFTNNMTGTTQGFESALNWNINGNLKAGFNYTYLDMTLQSLDPNAKGADKLYPRHHLGIKIFWNIAPKWTLDTTTAYVDNLPGGNIPRYTRLDVNIGAHLASHVRLNIMGQNLLDRNHREFGAVNDINAGEIERSIVGKITWQF